MIYNPLIKLYIIIISGLLLFDLNINAAPAPKTKLNKLIQTNTQTVHNQQSNSTISNEKFERSQVERLTCSNLSDFLQVLDQQTTNLDQITKNLTDICAIYKNLDKSLIQIINDYNLPRNFARYNKSILLARTDLAKIKRIIQNTKKLSSAEDSVNLKKSLNTLLNKILKQYNSANFAYYRAQHNIKDTGSFLIGASGYLKMVGQQNYLGLTKYKDKNIPLRVTIVPPVFSGLDIANGKCNDSYAVSFIVESNLNDFFTAREVMLTIANRQITMQNKQSILKSDDVDAAFCIEKQGDGFSIRVPGDNYINNTADNITRNINESGTFTFVSGIYAQKYDVKDSGEFKVGRFGYLKYLSDDGVMTNITEEPQKYKIIPALYESENIEVCHPDLSFSLELVSEQDDLLFTRVLSSNYFTVLTKYKDDIDSELEQKNASFCIETTGSNYKIKNFFGNYLKHNNANKKGVLTNNSESGSSYNFFDIYHSHIDYTQGEVGPFEIGKTGYIKINMETNQTDNFEAVVDALSMNDDLVSSINDASSSDLKSLYIETSAIAVPKKFTVKSGSSSLNNKIVDKRVLDNVKKKDDSSINKIIDDYASLFAEEQQRDNTQDISIGLADINKQGQSASISELALNDNLDSTEKEVEKPETKKTQTKLISEASRPVKFKVIPPRISDTTGICSESGIAVSLEIMDDKDHLLTRDEWQLAKVNKYHNSNDRDTIFCIEQVIDDYYIRDAGGYFIDNKAAEYTKNPDKYGKFNFVADISDYLVSTDDNDIKIIDNGPFNNNPTGYLKSLNSKVFLNVKNLNDNIFTTPRVKIISLDIDSYRDKGFCTADNTSPIQIIEHETSNLLANYYGKLYFINHTVKLSESFTTFCLQKSEDGYYKIFSEIFNNKLYLSITGNLLVSNFELAGNFTLLQSKGKSSMDRLTKHLNYGDIGYIKLADYNTYVNSEQFREEYNNKSDIPIKFRLIKPIAGEIKECPSSATLEDYDDTSLVLSYDRNTNKLKLIDKNAKTGAKKFCLEESNEGVGYFKLKTAQNKYIDKNTAGSITANNKQAGVFSLINRSYNDGISEHAFLEQASGKVIRVGDSDNIFYVSALDSGQVYLQKNVINAQGFSLEPGLSDEYCTSIRAINSNKYLIFNNNQFILTKFRDESLFRKRATFCTIANTMNGKTIFYPYNTFGYYLAQAKDGLTIQKSDILPLNDFRFNFAMVNKRNLLKQRINYRDPMGSLSCLNLSWPGKRIPGATYDLNSTCPTLISLRNNAMSKVDHFETSGQCCSGIAYRLPRSTHSFDGGRRCRVDYDVVCT